MSEFAPKSFANAADLEMAQTLELLTYSQRTVGLYSTYRELDKYARTFCSETPHFTETYLKGKKTLDLGSGYGGIAIDAAIKGIQSDIYSVSPYYGGLEYSTEEFFAHSRSRVENSLLAQGWTKSKLEKHSALINKAIARWHRRSYAAFGHNLPFADGYFDTVLDHYACGFSANKYPTGGHLYLLTLREVARVLKPNGMYLVGPIEPNPNLVSAVSLAERFCEITQSMQIIDKQTSVYEDILFLQKK